MDVESALTATLRRWNSVPFSWGARDDCMMSVFAHCELVTGRDAGAEWRGSYQDEAGAVRVLAAAGGGLAGMHKGLSGIGLKRVQAPSRGDPICARIAGHEIGGIWLGDMAAFRLEGRGRIDIRIEPAAAWALC